ncbi:acyl-CoA-like ligand-binding transcription factor [Patulibacter sp. S7RM1-6]
MERVAIELLLHEGFDRVSVEEIAAAAGIGRTTFFRYFPAKADVVWMAFDEAVRQLELELAADPARSVAAAIRDAVVASTRHAVDDHGVWLERFELLDTAPGLRASALEHWATWQAAIARFVAERTSTSPTAVAPAAIAGAIQATYVAELRSWGVEEAPEQLLGRLATSLTAVGSALETLLPPPAGSARRAGTAR